MIIIGHRGARGLAPENTLTSIQKGLDNGADEIEIDTRITKDGVAILSHDRALIADGRPYLISQHTLEELRTRNHNLTVLQDALELVAHDSVLVIEVKHGEPVEPVAADIKQFVSTHHKNPHVILSSKSQRVLRDLHAQLPEYPTIVLEPWSGVRAAYRARKLGTKRIGMRSWWLWRGFLKGMKKHGYQIVPYTMNDPVKVRKWEPYIYGIYTDFPDRFQDH